MHLETSLKRVCEELVYLIIKKSVEFKCKLLTESEKWIRNVKNFITLIESLWNIELSSLANEDIQEQKLNNPLLLSLASDIKNSERKLLKW